MSNFWNWSILIPYHKSVAVLKKQQEISTNVLTNSSTAFIWKLCCHWLRIFWQHYKAFAKQVPVSLYEGKIMNFPTITIILSPFFWDQYDSDKVITNWQTKFRRKIMNESHGVSCLWALIHAKQISYYGSVTNGWQANVKTDHYLVHFSRFTENSQMIIVQHAENKLAIFYHKLFWNRYPWYSVKENNTLIT